MSNTSSIFPTMVQSNYHRGGCSPKAFNVLNNNTGIRKLVVVSVSEGVITLEPIEKNEVREYLELVCGCFSKESNFFREVANSFCLIFGTEFKAITFRFNGVKIWVTAEDTLFELNKKWEHDWDAAHGTSNSKMA